jgi:hypothetical protein
MSPAVDCIFAVGGAASMWRWVSLLILCSGCVHVTPSDLAQLELRIEVQQLRQQVETLSDELRLARERLSWSQHPPPSEARRARRR